MGVIEFTERQYASQLAALLPRGPAWSLAADSNLMLLLNAFAAEFARLDARAHQLLDETDPRTAYELLGQWENVLGLPDACTAAATSLGARQAACWRKLAFVAGQTPAFYIALAASIGFEVEIHEFDPDVDDYDGTLTGLLGGGRYRYVWRVHVLNAGDFSYFRAGDPVGGRLVEGDGAIDLECVLSSAKPAHTHVVFSYPEDIAAPTVEYVSGVSVGFETPTAIDLSAHISGSHSSIEAGDGTHGTCSVAGDVVTYTPATGYIGGDVFSYRAIGAGGTSDYATVSLTVATVAAPTVSNLSGVSVAFNTATAIDLSGHVSGSHTSLSAGAPGHGSVTVAGDVVTYTPSPGYSGADSFTFTATGVGGTSAPATVSLTVAAIAAPSVAPAGFDVYRRTPTAFDLAAYVTGAHSSMAVASAPAHGSASFVGDVVTYTSVGAYTGSDSFTVTATGPGGTSAPATVSVEIYGGGGGGSPGDPLP